MAVQWVGAKMASVEDLAEDYAERISGARFPKATAELVGKEIAALTYEVSGLPIEALTITKLIDAISIKLKAKMGPYMIKEGDNKAYLQMVSIIIQHVGKK